MNTLTQSETDDLVTEAFNTIFDRITPYLDDPDLDEKFIQATRDYLKECYQEDNHS